MPRGRDADKVPVKEVGKIFKASPLLRPSPTSGPATSSLALTAETEQPIVIEDDDDAEMTGGAAGSTNASPKAIIGVPAKRRPPLKVPPSTRPRAVLKSAPSTAPRAPPSVNGTLSHVDQQWHQTSGWQTFQCLSMACRRQSHHHHPLPWHRQLRYLRPYLDRCLQQLLLRSQWVHCQLRVQLPSQRLHPLRLTPSSGRHKKSGPRGQPMSSSYMTQCLRQSSKPRSRTHSQSPTSGFAPQGRKTERGAISPRSLSSDHFQRSSRMT